MSKRPSASRPSTKSRETSDPLELEGRRAVVTGASSGIGQAIAIELARGGADLVIAARSSRQGTAETAGSINDLGRSVQVVLADLSTPSGCRKLLQAAFRRPGGVDIWVNNAGADILTGTGPGLGFEEKLRRLISLDVLATVRLSREAGARMRRQKGGVILNMGWDGARNGMEGESGELFGTAKAAVMGFTVSLALSLAPEVRVNCIAPGWIRTGWGKRASRKWQNRVRRETPLGRWGTPEDVARLARFLASPRSDYITGQVIAVNGGAVRF